MKRSKIIASLTSPHYGERLDEIESTLVALLRQRETDGLVVDEAKALIGVLLSALNGTSWGKSDRRLSELFEAIGGLVSTGDDRAAKVEAFCDAVLQLYERVQTPTKTHLLSLCHLLSGVCRARGPRVLFAVRATRNKCQTSHSGKTRHTEADRKLYKETRVLHGVKVQTQVTDEVLAQPSAKRLLHTICSLVTELLPESSLISGWLSSFPALVPHIMKEALAAKEPLAFLPVVLATTRLGKGAKGQTAQVVQVLEKCCKSRNERMWLYVESLQVKLEDADASQVTAIFTSMAAEAKRAIETVMGPLSALLQIFSNNLSGVGAIVKPLLEPSVKALNDASQKACARRAIGSVLRNVLDTEVRDYVISLLCKTIKDSKSTEERNISVATLRDVVPDLFANTDLRVEASKSVSKHLYPAVKSLAPSATLYELIGTCIREGKVVPDFIGNVMKEGHTNTEENVRHLVLAMAHHIEVADAKKMKELQGDLLKLCGESEKKLSSRVGALMVLSVVDLPPTAEWYKEGCLGMQPHLFSVENFRKLTETWQLSCAIKGCQRFLPPISKPAPGYSAARDLGPIKGLVLAATHPKQVVRKEAMEAISAAIKADPKLLNSFWTALLIVLWGNAPQKQEAAHSPKAAAKPAGKKGAKPAPKPAKGAKDVKDAVHPLIVDKNKFGKERHALWNLAEQMDGTVVLGEKDTDRREDPAAAGVFTLIVNELFEQADVMTEHLVAEVVFTAGHADVSGTIGNFWECTSPHLALYRKKMDTNTFTRIFGVDFVPQRMSDSYKAGHFLHKNRKAVRDALLSALESSQDREFCRVAAARALTFITLHSGADALRETLDEDRPAPAEGEEPLRPLLAEMIRNQSDKLKALTPLEIKIGECATKEAFDSAVQKQLEDDDVVPRFKKAEHQNVKRDKTQKGLYSHEDEEWERQMIAKKNAERGIEEPKVAKARAETRARFTDMQKSVHRERQLLNGMLSALIEVCRDSRNSAAVHACLPSVIPSIAYIWRHVTVKQSLLRASETFEWLGNSTPMLELRALSNTITNATYEMVVGRRSSRECGKKEYKTEVIGMVENLMKRLRTVCTGLLPPPSFSLLFPVIEAVAMHTHNFASFGIICQQQTLALTSTNCGTPDLPHKEEVSASLISLIDRTPTLSKMGISALTVLAENLAVNELGPITEGMLHRAPIVREAACTAAKNYRAMPTAPASTRYHLQCCTHDLNRSVSRKAQDAWDTHGLEIGADYIDVLVPRIIYDQDDVCSSIAATMAKAAEKFPDSKKLLMQQMFRAFDAQLGHKEQQMAPKTLQDPSRRGVAAGITALIPIMEAEHCALITKFSCMRALADVLEEVRDVFLTALQKMVATHGRQHAESILPTLQNHFKNGPNTTLGPAGAPGALTAVIRESYTASIVVVMGTLASKMEKSEHLAELATKLVEIANTPSSAVALSVFETMTTVITLDQVTARKEELVKKSIEKIVKGAAPFQVRRSQAHILAGIVRGLHLPQLHELGILDSLRGALNGKTGYGKEGALAAYSVFCERLDGLYEPYVIDSIGDVVRAFSEPGNVKKAADECSAAMMKSLSHFGVRQILPPLIASFDTENWRQKVSALNLLGQMSYCSPKQLAAALPKVMPLLCETLNDTHKDVQLGAWEALRRVGGVITNPEIAAHANVLLDALRDPTHETDNALEALMYTRFSNAIDAASLAVIEPVLRRGLSERISSIKLKAAQIIGSVALLVREKQLILPYLDGLLKLLKKVLMDEFPDCRSTAAKALGSLLTSLGEEHFPGLLEWCFDALQDTKNSHVERSGAAQGVAQVISSIGGDEMEKCLMYIQEKTRDEEYLVREGYLQVMVYVPHALGQSYQPYLKEMTPCVLVGLSDPQEGVRNMAVKAGQTVVHLFGMKCLDQLLPPLQEGLSNLEWRVRLSSLQLLGDLLMRVATENMKVTPARGGDDDEDDDEEGEEDEEDEESEESDEDGGKTNLQPQKAKTGPLTLRDLRRMRQDKTTNSLVVALGDVIGPQVLGGVMATVYMLTVDVIHDVSRHAKQVWKALVDNTPAMLRKIMEHLTPKLVEYISEDDAERREVAGRCVGDLVARLGDGFLPFIIPVLSDGLSENNSVQTRMGATLGFKEVVRCISRSQLATYSGTITPSIVKAIKDEDSDVREEAGQAFDLLFKNFGGRAIENLMNNLIDAIVSNDEQAMAGTLEMVKMRPRAVLQQLIPTFTKAGALTENLSRGLEQVALIAEENICVHIVELVPVFCTTLAQSDLEHMDQVVAALEAVVSFAESEDLYNIMGELRNLVQSSSAEERKGGAGIIGALVQCTTDLSEFNVPFIQNVIRLYGDLNEDVQRAALAAMINVGEMLENSGVLMEFTDTVHGALSTASMGSLTSNCKLPALDLTNAEGDKKSLGLWSVLSFYTKPLQSGSPEQREYAANGVLEVIEMVTVDTIKACVGDIMGPMIRKMNEAMPSTTKVAMLTCISACIKKVGTSAKQFIVMLQNAFPKNLNNSDPDVRRAALRSLWVLMNFQEPKLDPTLNSLIFETKNAHPAIQTALLRGITLCLSARPDAELGKLVITKCTENILPLFNRVANVRHAIAVGKACGVLAGLVQDQDIVRKVIDQTTDAVSQGGAMIALGMSGWEGLLLRCAGKPGFFHQDYVKFVQDALSVLPKLADADQRYTTICACNALASNGIEEIELSEVLKLSAALCKLGEVVVEGDRQFTQHLEDTLRVTLEKLLAHVPAKFHAPINKVKDTLAVMEYEEWETCAECQDDKREDEM